MRSSSWSLAAVAVGVVLSAVPALAGASRALGSLVEAPRVESPRAEVPASDSWVYLGPQRAQVARLSLSPLDPDLMLAMLVDDGQTPVDQPLVESTTAGMDWLADRFDGPMHDAAYDHTGRKLVAHRFGLFFRNPDQTFWNLRRHQDSPSEVVPQRVAPAPQAFGQVWLTASHGGSHRVFRLEHALGFWEDRTPALPAYSQPAEVAVSPSQPGRLAVAAIDTASNLARVFVSHDNGETWTASTPATSLGALSTLRWVGDRLFVGGIAPGSNRPVLLGSSDLGASWQVQVAFTDVHGAVDVTGDPAAPDRLWAGAGEGVYRSIDGGQTWLPPAAGGVQDILRLEYRAPQGQLFASVRDTGVWLSQDDGASWSARNHGLGALPVVSLAVDPQQPGHVAAAIAAVTEPRAQVATSADGGLDWLQDVAPPGGSIGAVRYGPSGALYATLTGAQQYTLMRRAPGGAWQHVGFEWPGTMFIEPGDVNFGASESTLLMSARVFIHAQSQWRSRVWRSANGGQSWAIVLDAGPEVRFAGIERTQGPNGLRLLVLQQSSDSLVPSRLWASDNDGQGWFDTVLNKTTGYEGQVCTGDEGRVLLLLTDPDAYNPRLHRSHDGGATWVRTAWTPDYTEGTPLTAMHCPGDAGRVFLGGQNGQLMLSDDGGGSFGPLLANTATWGDVPVRDIALTPAGLYAAHLNGVWVNPDFALPVPGPTDLVVQRTDTGARMRQRVTLQWQGGLARVDIRANGRVVATVDNTGAWSQLRLATGATEAWQVCDAGSSACTGVVGGR